MCGKHSSFVPNWQRCATVSMLLMDAHYVWPSPMHKIMWNATGWRVSYTMREGSCQPAPSQKADSGGAFPVYLAKW